MNFGLVLTAPLAVQIHLATVVPAFVLGTWLILMSTKGARPHRMIGATYMALMTITAISSLFIHEINAGGFSGCDSTLWGVL